MWIKICQRLKDNSCFCFSWFLFALMAEDHLPQMLPPLILCMANKVLDTPSQFIDAF